MYLIMRIPFFLVKSTKYGVKSVKNVKELLEQLSRSKAQNFQMLGTKNWWKISKNDKNENEKSGFQNFFEN